MQRTIMTGIFASAACLMALAAGPPARAAGVKITDDKDRQIVRQFCRHAERVPQRISADYCEKMAAEEPEGYTWKVLPQVDMLLTAYELTGEAKYLTLFAKTVANMRGAMTKGRDGFLGWYGQPLGLFRNPDDPHLKADVIISSFRMVDVLCRFLELVSAEPALAAKYAGLRREYVKLMTDHLVRKWDARGRCVEVGHGGCIYRTHAGLRDVKADLTQPHNKHSKIVQACLRLYRVTGEDRYMTRAVRLGTRFKGCLTLKDGHYEWNYWDPAGAWDVYPSRPGQWKHWIGPEHRSGYYSLSLTQAVMLWHHGLVFDDTDMKRFVKTQLETTWNASLDKPVFYRVDRSKGKQSGRYICAALAAFSEKVYAFLYTGARQDERLRRADHSWQGGPVADGYLRGKYLYCPKAKGGKPIYARFGKRFLSKPANRTLVESIRFEVTGAGYRAPATPAAMKPMPREPRPR